jgi:hypothetical protein
MIPRCRRGITREGTFSRTGSGLTKTTTNVLYLL